MILCTLAGPDPRAFNTSRRGAEVGKPLRDGGELSFRKAARRNANAGVLARQWHLSAVALLFTSRLLCLFPALTLSFPMRKPSKSRTTGFLLTKYVHTYIRTECAERK
jgi:hypothetical protein